MLAQAPTTEPTSPDIPRRKQTTDGVGYETGYAYNLSGALVEQTYPSGRVVKNVLDASGDLSMVQSARCMDAAAGTGAECTAQAGLWNYARHFTYNAAGAVTSMQLGNGRWESTVFNSRLQPVQIALGSSGTGAQAHDLLKLDYGYGGANNNGNVLSQTITVKRPNQSDLVFDQLYTYDSLNRITSAEEKTGTTVNWNQTYTFDRYGNRNFNESLTTTLPKGCMDGSTPVVCEADKKSLNPVLNASDNRMAAGQGWSYDAAGNVIGDPEGRSFTYDAENKQIAVENSQSQTVGEYYFDGDGKRVKKHVPSTGEVTVFIYDAGGKLIGEYSTIVETVDPKVQYLTADHLGSPRINTDENGLVTSRTDYMPYGEEIIALGGRSADENYVDNDIRKGFTGYEKDNETGLDYAQARYFKSRHGRFTSVDPLMASARTTLPQSWNRYVYCWNNPLKLIDPDGKDVQLLDEKAKERLLSTLPEELRKQVEQRIDKKGLLKKGALDKIKSTDANFLDLRSAVNAKGTLEIMTGGLDPSNGEAFFYKSDTEERKELVAGLIDAGSTPEEAEKEADEFMNNPDRVRSMGLGVTLSPADKGGSPNGNFRVVLSDGTGNASDAPKSDMAAISAHEIYGHGLRALQGKPWRHEFNHDKDPPEPPGPVDTAIKQIEQRTRNLYKRP